MIACHQSADKNPPRLQASRSLNRPALLFPSIVHLCAGLGRPDLAELTPHRPCLKSASGLLLVAATQEACGGDQFLYLEQADMIEDHQSNTDYVTRGRTEWVSPRGQEINIAASKPMIVLEIPE
jgi:hypothetical protein